MASATWSWADMRGQTRVELCSQDEGDTVLPKAQRRPSLQCWGLPRPHSPEGPPAQIQVALGSVRLMAREGECPGWALQL